MISECLYGHEVDIRFETLSSVFPELRDHTAYQVEHFAPPKSSHTTDLRLFKSHSPFSVSFPNIIYIVRDPRDVAVSYYYYRIKRGIIARDTSIEEHVDEFLSGLHTFGSWKQHVGGWLGACQNEPTFHWLRYEDILDGSNEIPFVRSASSGNWEEELPSSSARRIEDRWRDLMEELEYL